MSAVSEIASSRKVIALEIVSFPSVLDAARLMVKNKVGSVVVLDVDKKPIGIITERDILKKVTALNKSPRDIAVQDIMSHPVVTIKTYYSIETAAALMAKNKIKRLVVLEQDGSVAGVLSNTDIARKLTRILTNDYGRYGHLKAILDF